MAGDDPFSDDDLAAIKGAMGAAPEAHEAPALADGDVAAVKDALAGKGAHAPAAPVAPKPTAKPTRFQEAVRAAPEEPELSWRETGSQALKNLPSSAKDAGSALVHAVAHPIETGKNLGHLGHGLGSQVVGALGVEQDPAQKAKVEDLARAVEDHYKTAYGSVKGFKKTVATDPVSVAMDASVALDGVGAVSKVAGLSKTASVLSKAAALTDPVRQSVNIARTAGKVIGAPIKSVARHAASVTTGVPPSLMKVAEAAGKTEDPTLRAAFLRFARGQGRADEFLQTAQSALDSVRGEASDAYLAGKSALASANPAFQPIEDAIRAARNETMKGGLRLGQFKEANAAIDETEKLVQAWKTAADPAYRDLFGFDNLKQAVWDIRDSYGNSAAKKHLGAIYHAVKNSIVDVDPAYAQLMENYQTARNNIIDLQKTLVGGGANPAATSSMAKSLRVLKTGTGPTSSLSWPRKSPRCPSCSPGTPWSPGWPGACAARSRARRRSRWPRWCTPRPPSARSSASRPSWSARPTTAWAWPSGGSARSAPR
jgi:hypothetical protein